MTDQSPTSQLVLTIGHSTHSLEEFLRFLQAHGVETVVDVRTVPYSRHNPQFNREELANKLAAAGIGYRHLPGLGGWRRPRPDSPHMGLRTPGFRGFADYMDTPEFAEHLENVMELARRQQVALMCAEAVPWRCHRSLIADALLARGVAVEHILGLSRRQPHTLTPGARIAGSRLTYPRDEGHI